MATDTQLKGLRVAVTGGTSGLGTGPGQAAYRPGRSGRLRRPQSPAVERIGNETGAFGIVGDIGRKEDIYPIALQITGNFSGLDVLINNASSVGPTPLVSRRH